ncbi:MAG: NifU family protein [Acidobacteria bacterium]|nr:NifU family protein [Acidobacteriota bacterium]
MTEQSLLNEKMARVEELVRAVEMAADPALRAQALELVQTLMEFHGAALERMMDITAETGAAGQTIFDDFAADELVGSLLLLYGLHPLPVETRVRQALERVRPALNLHEGGVELVAVDGGIVRLRLQGNCDGCPSSALTLKTTIEEAVYAAAPEIGAVEVEDSPAEKKPNGFVRLGRSKPAYRDCELAAA